MKAVTSVVIVCITKEVTNYNSNSLIAVTFKSLQIFKQKNALTKLKLTFLNWEKLLIKKVIINLNTAVVKHNLANLSKK